MKFYSLSRKGYLVFYGLSLLVILGFYASGLQFKSIDQNNRNRFAKFDSQRKFLKDMGLEICLQVATHSFPTFGSYSLDLGPAVNLADTGIPSEQNFATITFIVDYSTTEAIGYYSFASFSTRLVTMAIYRVPPPPKGPLPVASHAFGFFNAILNIATTPAKIEYVVPPEQMATGSNISTWAVCLGSPTEDIGSQMR